MTRDEVRRVLAELTAAFPNFTIEKPTVEVWVQSLAHDDSTFAKATVDYIVANDSWFPTVARFNEAKRLVAGKASGSRLELPESTAGPVSKEQAKENIARLRQMLADSNIGKKASSS